MSTVQRRTPALNTLRAFAAAARSGSFARASAELHVTAAAVSHQVKELEQSLGVLLFRRLPRGVALTDAGKRYYEEISKALELVATATERLDTDNLVGPLRISVPQSFGQLWLSSRLRGFAERFPDLQLSIKGDNRLADVRGGETDIAIRFGAANYPALSTRFLFGDAVSVFVNTAQLNRMSDTRLQSVLSNSVLLEDDFNNPEEPWMSWQPWLRQAGIREDQVRNHIVFSGSALAIGASQAGAGVVIGRMSLVSELLQRRQLTALMPWRPTEYVYQLLTRSGDDDNPRVAAFVSWMKTEVKRFVAETEQNNGVQLSVWQNE